MALALVVQQMSETHELSISAEEGSRIFFVTGGVISLTLIINATLAQRLLYALGIVDDDAEELRIMQHYARYYTEMAFYYVKKCSSLIANF
jgi:hypothetical protein